VDDSVDILKDSEQLPPFQQVPKKQAIILSQ